MSISDETLVQTFQAQVELQGVTEDHKPVDIIAAEDTRNRSVAANTLILELEFHAAVSGPDICVA